MPTLIVASNIHKAHDAIPALDGVSLAVAQGEQLCVLGPSGAGKSSLLRCLNLLDLIDAGSIVYGGHPVIDAGPAPTPGAPDGALVNGAPTPATMPPASPRRATARRRGRRHVHVQPDRFRRKFGFIFEDENLFPHRTVLENMIEGPVFALRRRRSDALDEANDLLAAYGLSALAQRRPHELTRAQRHRVALVRALMMKPELMLVDEITNDLYPAEIVALQELLRAMRRTHGAAMVMVTHHIEFAQRIADRVCFMSRGRIVEQGPPGILAEPQTLELRQYVKIVRSAR